MEWSIRAHSVHTALDKIQDGGDCAFIPYEALIPYCERKVIHTTGQVFEFKWTMTILIERLLVPSLLLNEGSPFPPTVKMEEEIDSIQGILK